MKFFTSFSVVRQPVLGGLTKHRPVANFLHMPSVYMPKIG